MFKKNHNGTEIIKSGKNSLGNEVLLTRKTTKRGNIRHAVILSDGSSYWNAGSFLGVASAFRVYKFMVAL